MKPNISTRAAVAAIGAFCAATMLPSISLAAGAVKVNNNAVCVSGTSTIGLDPAGDLTITCTTPGGGGGPTARPICSVVVSAPSITLSATSSATSSVTASCDQSPDSYAWSSTGGPSIANAGGTLTYLAAGTYTYTVMGQNSLGNGPISTPKTVTVAPYAGGGGGGGGGASGCSTTAVDGAFTGRYGQFVPAIPRGGYVSYELPVYSTPGTIVRLDSAQSTNSQNYLWTEFAVSKCPGEFAVDSQCRVNGIAEAMSLSPTSGLAETPGIACTMQVGVKYYLNIKNVYNDHVTPSCNVGTCWLVVQLHSN